MNAKREQLSKYITKKRFEKLNAFVLNNIQIINEFDNEFHCDLYNGQYKTTLLYYLFSHDFYELASLILKNGFDIYKGYDASLMIQILKQKEENVKYLKLLVENGYQINHKCAEDMSTLLHMSCIACNHEAVNYLLDKGAFAFEYTSDMNSVNVKMGSFIFGVDDNITPLCLVTELTNEIAIRIAISLLASIPDIELIKNENSNEIGFNADIDGLLTVALRDNIQQGINLLFEMNFNFSAFKKRAREKRKFNENWMKNLDHVNWQQHTLKGLCRLKIRSSIGALEPTAGPVRTFLKRLNSLNLPNQLLQYLNFNVFY